MILAGAQIIDEGGVAYKPDNKKDSPRDSPGPSYSLPSRSGGEVIARPPSREPVDIQFTQITCTVKLGINKGIFFLLCLFLGLQVC